MLVSIETQAAIEQLRHEQEQRLAEQRRNALDNMTDDELDDHIAAGLRSRGWTVRRPSSMTNN